MEPKTRAETIMAAILLLSPDQFTQAGLPDVSELNAAMPEGSAPVTAAERTEVWETMKTAPTDIPPSTEPEDQTPPDDDSQGDDDEEPQEDETLSETVRIIVIKAACDPVTLTVNARKVATLPVGKAVTIRRVYLAALADTDTKFKEV